MEFDGNIHRPAEVKERTNKCHNNRWRKYGHRRVSPHTIRHVTAMGLLQSGVDLNTIRVWLGHVSLQTTHIYAESDLKMKAEALARCEAPLLRPGRNPSAEKGLMGFLSEI